MWVGAWVYVLREGLLRQADVLEDDTLEARQGTRQSNHDGQAAVSGRGNQRESDVILKVMRAGAGIPEVDD